MDKINYEKYLKFKNEIKTKTFYERFNSVQKSFHYMTFLGNGISIYLAFFFFFNLLSKSFETNNTTITSIIIILFLCVFELIKRKVFDVFSLEIVKNKGTVIKKDAIIFSIITLMIISCSFFFSLNGAKEFMNKENKIVSTFETKFNDKSEEITNKYQTRISVLEKKLDKCESKLDVVFKAKKTKRWLTDDEKTILKQESSSKIRYEKEITSLREKEEKEISDYKLENKENIKSNKEENKNNVFVFLLISSLIEIIILGGIYFKRIFEYKTVTEYEKKIIKSPSFKKWCTYNSILDIIFKDEDIKINQPLLSTKNIQDIVELGESDLSKKDIDDCFKICLYLNFYKTEGNRRILKKTPNECKTLLKEHYNII